VFSFFKKSGDKPIPAEAPSTPTKSAVVDAPVPVVEAAPKSSWTQRLKQGLSRTREQFGKQLTSLFSRGGKIDADLYDELETILLTADVGVDASQYLLDSLRQRVKKDRLTDATQLQAALHDTLCTLLSPLEQALDVSTHKPYVINAGRGQWRR